MITNVGLWFVIQAVAKEREHNQIRHLESKKGHYFYDFLGTFLEFRQSPTINRQIEKKSEVENSLVAVAAQKNSRKRKCFFAGHALSKKHGESYAV
jgi:hypothetical protein